MINSNAVLPRAITNVRGVSGHRSKVRVFPQAEKEDSDFQMAELKNWVRLPDGRYQGKAYKRSGIDDGKIIATSKARLIAEDQIKTDTGTIYKLMQPAKKEVISVSEVEQGYNRAATIESVETESMEDDDMDEDSKLNYDPIKTFIQGFLDEKKTEEPMSGENEQSYNLNTETIHSNSISSPPSKSAFSSQSAGQQDSMVEQVMAESGIDIKKTPPIFDQKPIGGGDTPIGSSSGNSVEKAQSILEQLNSLPEEVPKESDPEVLDIPLQTSAKSQQKFVEPKAMQRAAKVQENKEADMMLKEEVDTLELGRQSEVEQAEAADAIMPSAETREQSLQGDELMTMEVAKKISDTEKRVSKKGTGWLTNLLGKGAATLVNSPINVNNQFNTVVQYNFGDGKKRDLAQCKSELLIAIADVDRGLKATDEERDKIENLIRAMEAGNPTKTPLKNPLLNGRWALLYTTARGILGEGNPIRPSGPIYQSIDIFGLRILNEQAYEPVPFVRWTTSAEGDLYPKSNSRAEVKFGNYRVGGLKVQAPPSDPARRMIEWELEVSGKGTPAWIDNTYVDENLRVARDHKGNVFVMKRDDP